MAPAPSILAFAGSTRTGSYNKKLIRAGAEAARNTGAEVTLLDLRDYPLPLFDGDLEREQGLPPHALELKRLMRSHDGFLISAPEYNTSVTGVLKNAIDWASRQAGADDPPLSSFEGKLAALLSASPGALGGLRGLIHLRAILSNIGVLVLPRQKALPRAHEAFDEHGALKNEADRKALARVVEALVEVAVRLRNP